MRDPSKGRPVCVTSENGCRLPLDIHQRPRSPSALLSAIIETISHAARHSADYGVRDGFLPLIYLLVRLTAKTNLFRVIT